MKKSILIILLFIISSVYGNKLEDVKKAGVLRAGVSIDVKPLGFMGKYGKNKGKIIGFDIDLLDFIAQKLGVKLKLVVVNQKNKIDYLLKNKVDIIAAATIHKKSLDKIIDFTETYYIDGQVFLVPSNSTARGYKDLDGYTIGCLNHSRQGQVAQLFIPTAGIKAFNTYQEAVNALQNKQINALTGDFLILEQIARQSRGAFKIAMNNKIKNKHLRLLKAEITRQPYAFGVPENESDFKDEINFIIQAAVYDRGNFYNNTYKKWFGMVPIRKPELWP